MGWEFKDDRPIYLQLIDQLQLRIISGIYKTGDKLPSVRELASEASVNPNTMQKALTELERKNLVFTQRTSGRFITEDIDLINKIRNDLAKKEIESFLNNMKNIGYAQNEIINIMDKFMKEMK
ncbi:GntR family transcriptional regulator [Clostridium botulinum]|uniref:Transcriptional regulator, GntR family n=2 Tax=Clostridium botulinum TaxID=1491 RepID=B2TKT0_CLOBB|nr:MULTISPECIES: GntR family transcriptional regulator [Clostridium]ACD23554.1 transcriptional regulator, GntR family [Clostridium botulinum B str. Eklund 17B (NRP)]ACD52950.1 transcriptional regulator, GntR family [Clostridium botulinum E3 str. Alaska E43]AJF28677.1 GntR family transcriptional regulator [Clostridium botulinum]AJF31738.1 GntR family transcriptional regulator [Clostridium botulinum]KAI3344881.1 GntR family transcriptional regulator [Clostridium botulinum]